MGLYKNNRLYAVHTDHLGTPRNITDDTNKVVWQWSYSGFGENKPSGVLQATYDATASVMRFKGTTPSVTMTLRFPGQYFDSESNLSYNYLRSYRAAQGRYDQADPLGLGGGWSKFGYVGANPLKFTDPRGLCIEDLCVGEAIAAAALCARIPACAAGVAAIVGGAVYNQGAKPGAGASPPATGVPEQSWPSYPPYNPTDTSGADKEARDKCSATYDAQIKVCQLTSATPTARQACYARAANEYGNCLKKNCR
jgi:RHS repeat-associated protein